MPKPKKSSNNSSSGNSHDYDEKTAKSDSEKTSAKGPVRFVIQGEAGFGGEFLEESKVEDKEIQELLLYKKYNYGYNEDTTDVFADYVYANIFLGLEFVSFVTVGVGFGVGSYFMSATGDDDLDEMLPGGSFAPNITAEATLGTDFVLGVRYRYIFDSRWPSSRISGIGELLNVFGLEIGTTSTEGLGDNIFVSFYIRFPTRGNLKGSLDKKK